MYTDSIEQLRGTAGARQVGVRAETALAAFTTPSSGGWVIHPKWMIACLRLTIMVCSQPGKRWPVKAATPH
jgi:hypothetical protein